MDSQSFSGGIERQRGSARTVLLLVAGAGLVALFAWSVWLTVPIARSYLPGTFAADSQADFASNPSGRFAPQRAASDASRRAPSPPPADSSAAQLTP